jgi:hypothetical protein
MFQTSLILYVHCTFKEEKKSILNRSGCFERHFDLSRFFSYSLYFNNIQKVKHKKTAMAENRTRINCLEGSYADHYTTNAS